MSSNLVAYQHPFVDLFKYGKVYDYISKTQKDQIIEGFDSSISKKVFKMTIQPNLIPSLQIPPLTSDIKSLNLLGKYIYIQCIDQNKGPFYIHFDYTINHSRSKIISLSNSFNSYQILNNKYIQIPLHIENKWSLICIHIHEILSEQKPTVNLKSFKISGNITIRNLFSSNLLYNEKTIPKDMSFKSAKENGWNTIYSWIEVSEPPEISKGQKIDTKEEDISSHTNFDTVDKYDLELMKSTKNFNSSQVIKETLQTKAVKNNLNLNQNVERSDDNELKPDPLMSLFKIIPSVSNFCTQCKFIKYDKSNENIAYGTQNLMIIQNIKTGFQKYFVGHSSPIINIFCLNNTIITLGSNNEFILWNYAMKIPQFVFSIPLFKVTSLTETKNCKVIYVAGKDALKREAIILIDKLKLVEYKEVQIICRQICDFDICTITSSPMENDTFVSCGFENVRLWKNKNCVLKSESIQLGFNSKKKKFIECIFKYIEKRCTYLFAINQNGELFKINYVNRQVEQVVKLHIGEIISIQYIIKNNTYATAGSDHNLKIWNHDFSECLLACNNESKIKSFDISIDGDKYVTLLENGSINAFFLAEKRLETIVKGHLDKIIDADYNSAIDGLITSSNDFTISVWGKKNQNQIAVFHEKELATAISSHPTLAVFAAGFSNGHFKVFNIENQEIISDNEISDTKIIIVTYSPDSKTVIIANIEGVISILHTFNYHEFKTIEIDDINPNFFDLKYSPQSDIIGITGQLSNRILIWDTNNYALQDTIELADDFTQKFLIINSEEIVILTASSKLIYYKKFKALWTALKTIPDIHKSLCLNILTTKNNSYLFTCGKDKIINAFYYDASRHETGTLGQAFLGHSEEVTKMILSNDNRHMFTIGDESNIYIWEVFSDSSMSKIKVYDPLPEKPSLPPIDFQFKIEKSSPLSSIPQEFLTKKESNNSPKIEIPSLIKSRGMRLTDIEKEYVIGINNKEFNSLVWVKHENYLIWCCNNKLIIQKLETKEKQKYCLNSSEVLNSITSSPNQKYLVAFTKTLKVSPKPILYAFDSSILKILSEFIVPGSKIVDVDFSPNSNLLLVVTNEKNSSIINICDFFKGEILVSKIYNKPSVCAKWNPCTTLVEFVICHERNYTIWNVTKELVMTFVEGKIPDNFEQNVCITSASYSKPHKNIEINLIIIGLSDGKLWFVDPRTRYIASVIQFCDVRINCINCGFQRINIQTDSYLLYSIELNPELSLSLSEIISLFINKKDCIQIDSRVTSIWFEELGYRGFILSELGAIMFVNWLDKSFLRIFNHTDAEGQIMICNYGNYPGLSLVANYSSDEFLRIWNLNMNEQIMKLKVSGERCWALAFHPHEPILIGSYSDMYLRFIDIKNTLNLGRCTINSKEKVINIKFLPSGIHILCLTDNGTIFLLTVDKFMPLTIRIAEIINSKISGSTLEISPLEPFNRWMITSKIGKILIYNKRLFNESKKEEWQTNELPNFTLIDQLNVEDFVVNGCQEMKENRPSKPSSKKSRAQSKNLESFSNTTIGCFLNKNTNLYAFGLRDDNHIFIRNLIEHQIIKQYAINSKPISICLSPNTNILAICLSSKKFYFIDYENEDNSLEKEADHYEELLLTIFISNDQFISVGKGEIIKWHVK